MSDKSFYDMMMNGRKVERVLKSIGVDLEKFEIEYKRNRKPYPRRQLSPTEMDAVEFFIREPSEVNKADVMAKLGIKTEMTLYKLCTENAGRFTK